ncbi:MAG: dihydrodipicolinate synthase family protein [Rhodospirillales bacterium]|nr:dihydrodipicolinate synthase family protein [Rhodospirillales bacterium]
MAQARTDWKGVFTPIVTPFTPDGAFDEAAVRQVVDQQIAEGAHGIIAAGSTGEWFSLTDDERIRLFEVCKEQVAGRRPLLAGTAAIGTDQAVAMTRAAKKIGCDGCMVLPPPYALPSRREVIAHYKSIADVGLPIMLYNNPNRTQIDLVPSLVDDLAAFDAVVAIKDSSKDLFQKAETCHRVKDRLAVFTGMEPYALTMIQRGVVGIVSMMANVCCTHVVANFEHSFAGRYAEAMPHQDVIDRAFEIIARHGLGNYPTIKAMMNVLGRCGGDVRQPYLPAPDDVLAKIRDELAAIGLTAASVGNQAAAE